LFFIYFFRFFLRRWMARSILARWIQLDPRALDLFDWSVNRSDALRPRAHSVPLRCATQDLFCLTTFFFVWLCLFGPDLLFAPPRFCYSSLFTPPWFNFIFFFSLFPKALIWPVAYLSYFGHLFVLKFFFMIVVLVSCLSLLIKWFFSVISF
jgi:hypothetical protein